jgi:hypothetical protein
MTVGARLYDFDADPPQDYTDEKVWPTPRLHYTARSLMDLIKREALPHEAHLDSEYALGHMVVEISMRKNGGS